MRHAARFIGKMKSWPFFTGVNLLLAVTVFLCALLGRTLGIQGPALAISVVWPATGVSLAALLIFGFRAWPGIFLGNLIYNLNFYLPEASIHITPLAGHIAAAFVSLGSLVQALVGAYVIHNFSSPIFFRNVRDVFIFLVPASMIACIIGSLIGISALAISGSIGLGSMLPLGLTFWLGDTVGIYVITPMLVVWTLLPMQTKPSEHLPSLICMTLLFVSLATLTYIFEYPLPHLFITISIWAAYLFRMHGASMTIFLMTAASIAFAVFVQGYQGTSLIALITFIGATTAASLIIAAVVNEREEVLQLLHERNIFLEKEVDFQVDVIDLVRSEAHQFRRQIHLSESSGKTVGQLESYLQDISGSTDECLKALEIVQQHVSEKQGLNSGTVKILDERIELMRRKLAEIRHTGNQTYNIIKTLKQYLH